MINKSQSFTNEERKNYIGGSDISAVMGLNRYKTPLRLWLEKTGGIKPDDLSNNEKVQWGIKLEEIVAQEFSERTGKKVIRQTKTYTHNKYPFLVAHVDRLIVGTDELLECKTSSNFNKDWNDDGIPQEYILQVMWYLGITGRKKGYIACLINGSDFQIREIEFDENVFNLMVISAVKFWEMVQKLEAPAVTANDGDTLQKMYPTYVDDIQEMQELEALIALRQQASQEKDDARKVLKEKEKVVDEYDNELKSRIKSILGVSTDKYLVTWKDRDYKSLDKARMVADGIDVEKYTNTTTRRKITIKINPDYSA